MTRRLLVSGSRHWSERLYRFVDGRYLYALVPLGAYTATMPRVFYGKEFPLTEIPALYATQFDEDGTFLVDTDPFSVLLYGAASLSWGGWTGPHEWGYPVPPGDWSVSVSGWQAVLIGEAGELG